MKTNAITTRLLELVLKAEGLTFGQLAELAGLIPSSDFRFADLRGVQFAGTHLRGFDMTGAELSECSFKGAWISGAIFDDANVSPEQLRQALDFGEAWQPYGEHPYVAAARPAAVIVIGETDSELAIIVQSVIAALCPEVVCDRVVDGSSVPSKAVNSALRKMGLPVGLKAQTDLSQRPDIVDVKTPEQGANAIRLYDIAIYVGTGGNSLSLRQAHMSARHFANWRIALRRQATRVRAKAYRQAAEETASLVEFHLSRMLGESAWLR